MRILHLAPRLSERGGADLCLLGLARAQALRHEVHLAVGGDDGTARAPRPPLVVEALGARGPEACDLEPLLRRVRPDVLHVHHVTNPAVLEAAARAGAVFTVQDHRAFCPARGKWKRDGTVCRESFERATCAACFEDDAYFREVLAWTEARRDALRGARVSVLSGYMRDELVRAGLDAADVRVIPPFVHGLDLAATPDGPPCVLFCGRLVAAKGPFEAVEAWRRSGTDLPLVFAGTGSARADLEAAGHEVLGWLPRERLARTYARARALVLPSRWQEPFGLVGLEALAFGAPVAAWDSGGVGDWHPGEGLVAWGDVDALAAVLAEAVARRAAARADYSAERAVAETDALYAA